ncbi:MAG: DNA methyltransferase [Pseudomonadota bacterium]
MALQDDGKTDEAIDLIRDFKRSLCNIRVLDPACGSGNFLYVALEGMKRLEGEVAEALRGLGETQSDAFTVDPSQFLGIELNPWAAQIAELVLWIGYLQWHYRTFGKATPSQPVLRDFHNIENRDALLVLEGKRRRIGEDGAPVTRWDGETMKRHPATGEMVPDASKRLDVYDYDSAAQASWPKADFIVGNPPFIGASRMREALGDGYVETLWATYPKMPQSADFIMFWWEKAALPARAGMVRRFGFITTNSLRQTFNRRML